MANILLLNLVLSSMIFMSSLPFMAVYTQLSTWVFGIFMCKIIGSLYFLGYYSSVLFLTLLTFDRHLAVVYSFSSSEIRNRKYALLSCTVVWVVSCLACIKHVINFTLVEEYPNEIQICDENHNSTYMPEAVFYIQTSVFFVLPLILIIYCYVRIAITVMSSRIVRKFKTVRLIFIIVLLFFLSCTPYNIILILEWLSEYPLTCEYEQNFSYAVHVTRTLAYVYFCISPILYTFVGKKFQNYFRQMLVKRFPSLRKHISVSLSRNNPSTKTTRNDL